MAPFYLGLAFCLLLMLIHFCRELVHLVVKIPERDRLRRHPRRAEPDRSGFTANLVLIVILSGYENFVSRIEVGNHHDRPDWMTKVDFGGLKQKLMTSIVAISAIQVLKAFMNIEQQSGTPIRPSSPGWSASTCCSSARCWWW